MSFTVNISQHDSPITIETGQTILEAALAQGVPYPHGCRSGNCGACKSQLFSGDVEILPHSEFALSKDEKASGLVLACRTVPWEDVGVTWLGDDDVIAHPFRKMTGRVVSVDTMTHDIKRVRVKIQTGGPFAFSAGQYASVTFDGYPARDYSMANRPAVPVLEFHIRHVAGGEASTHVQENLAKDDVVRIEGPYGSSWLRNAHRGPIIALAGGSGIASIKSIVEQALSQGMKQAIHLYFGVRDERDLYLEARFIKLCEKHKNLRFVPVLSESAGCTERRTGLVHETVSEDFDNLDGAKAYLAGPPPMVEAATEFLRNGGVSRADIHADAFYTALEKTEMEKPP